MVMSLRHRAYVAGRTRFPSAATTTTMAGRVRLVECNYEPRRIPAWQGQLLGGGGGGALDARSQSGGFAPQLKENCVQG
jgi:hypothetical protein